MFRPDVYRPNLTKDAKVAEVTDEQWANIRRVLDYASSDTMFAQKALEAIQYILTEAPLNPVRQQTPLEVRKSEVNPDALQTK